ncbi:MAG: hypothetical protein LBB36_07270 [Fibromonadaceae bacterium]|jgi:hypothetical protein|nr:hypothetical protein [Fibromonadaceae bacterium]
MEEPTFHDIWNNLLLPLVGEILTKSKQLADFEYLNNYEKVKNEYEDLKSVIKTRMLSEPNRNKLMDRHKIASAFTIAVAKTAQFRIDRKKYDNSNLKEENDIEFLLKMGCNRLGPFIVDYVLAWKAGLNILEKISIKEERENVNEDYISFLEENGFYYPEPSNTFPGANYEVQSVRALYWTIERTAFKQISERTGIFFLANMFYLIEKYSKTKYEQITLLATQKR